MIYLPPYNEFYNIELATFYKKDAMKIHHCLLSQFNCKIFFKYKNFIFNNRRLILVHTKIYTNKCDGEANFTINKALNKINVFISKKNHC